MTALVGSSSIARSTTERDGDSQFITFCVHLSLSGIVRDANRVLTRSDRGEEQPHQVPGWAVRPGGFWSNRGGVMSYLLLIDDPGQLVTQVRQAFPAAPETGGPLVDTCPATRQVYKAI